MAFPRAAQAIQPIERRAVGRARADCPARLQTAGGDWHGRLWDISEGGARLLLANPPAEGIIALLRWNGNEAFCRIVWSSDDMCGVAFERQLERSVVAGTIGEGPADLGPTASVSNIPIGQRRSRLGSADEG